MRSPAVLIALLAFTTLGGCGVSYDVRVTNDTDVPLQISLAEQWSSGNEKVWLAAAAAPGQQLKVRVRDGRRSRSKALRISAMTGGPGGEIVVDVPAGERFLPKTTTVTVGTIDGRLVPIEQ